MTQWPTVQACTCQLPDQLYQLVDNTRAKNPTSFKVLKFKEGDLEARWL